LVGCASINYEIPRTFDLTGSWVLDEGLSDVTPDVSQIQKSEQRRAISGKQSDPSGSATFIVHDFPVVAAEKMRIEQDSDSMGIQYDDAPYADYKWGRQLRNRWRIEVGWNGEALLISKTRGSVRGSETYTLYGNVLSVRVHVNTASERIVLNRVYTRNE
jgi:hypothetical protein